MRWIQRNPSTAESGNLSERTGGHERCAERYNVRGASAENLDLAAAVAAR